MLEKATPVKLVVISGSTVVAVANWNVVISVSIIIAVVSVVDVLGSNDVAVVAEVPFPGVSTAQVRDMS